MPITASKPHTTTLLSLFAGVLILALKYLAYRVTGSVSLYSDALESFANVAAASVALFAVRLAARPPDVEHPFGHSKAEYFSAVAEGAFILFAAVEILRSAWARLADPVAPEGLGLGVILSVAATLINAGLGAFLIRTGRQHRSPALVADGYHLYTDVFTTGGVLAGIGLAWLTGWWVLDPILAIVVAINILRIGLHLVRESVGGLMDISLPDEEMERVQALIAANMDGALEAHALRSRHAGRHTFTEFHLVVPGEMSVAVSHAICDHIQRVLQGEVPGSIATIHVEPEGKAKHQGQVVRLGFTPSTDT